MGEGKLKQSDIAVDDLYGNIIKSAKDLTAELDKAGKGINKNVEQIATSAKQSEAISQKGINNLIKMQKLMEANFKRAQTNDREKIKTAKLLSSAQNQQAAEDRRIANQKAKVAKEQESANRRLIADKKKLATEQDRLNKKAAQEAEKIRVNNTAYKKLTNSVNKATMEFKELAATHGVNSKQAQRAAVKLDRLDKELRGVNNRARDGRRDVGRYGLALNSVRGSALKLGAALGIAGGGFMALRGGLKVLTEFDEKLADISKTTGLTIKQAREVSTALFEIDTKTSISNLQALVEAGGRLNIQGTANLVAFAESADKVFVALGDDLEGTADEIATNLGKIASQFGLEGEFGIAEGIERTGSGINDLAAKSKAGAGEILNFTNRMAGLGKVIELSDAQALGALFDESGQSIEVAASTLQKLIPELANDFERFAKVAGKTPKEFKKIAEDSPIEALKAVALGAQNSEEGVFNLTKIIESFGIESARATGVVGVLTNNVDRLTELQLISGNAIKENTSLTEEFNTKNDTLGATMDKAKKKLHEQVIAFNNNTEATKTLKNAIVFLVDNMGTIVTVLVRVVKFYALYRAALIALKLSNHVKEIVAQRKALKGANIEQGKMSVGAKKLKGALKSIGWAAAIALAIELGNAIIDAASGAKLFREELARFNRLQKGFDKTLDNSIRLQKEALKVKLDLIDADLASKDINEAKAIELKAKATRVLSGDISGQIKEKKRLDEMLVRGLRNYEETEKAQGSLTVRQESARKEQQRLITANRNQITTLKGVRTELNDTATGYEKINREIKNFSEETEEQVSLLREIEDAQLKQIENEHELATLEAAKNARRDIEDIEENTDPLQRAQLTIEIEKNLLLELTRIDKEYRDARLERIKAYQEKEASDALIFQANLLKALRLKLLEEGKTDEEIEKALLDARIEILQMKSELTLDEEIELQEKLRKVKEGELAEEKAHQEKLVDLKKKALEKLDELAEKAFDKAIEKSQEKQDILDEEISNSQKLEDRLREAAANQNAIATESLAAQESITEEKEREKVKEAKKEALLEEVKALWKAFTAFLSQGDGVIQASGKAAGGVTGFKAIVKGLTGFAKGTTGKLGDEHSAQMSGTDGHVVRVDSEEMIFSGDKVAKAAAANLHTTDDIVNSAIMNQQSVYVPMANPIDDRVQGSSSAVLEAKVDKLIAATENNAPFRLTPLMKRGLVEGMVESQKKNGNTINNTTYRA